MHAFAIIVTAVLDWLKLVPNVVWSGIVGSLVTVVGVLFTNLGLSKRHREQLAHSARESAVEREMDLRRDIYIPAIEATVVAFSAIGSMSDPTVKQSDVNEKFSDALAKIGKANAIATAETVHAIGDLTDGIRELFTRLIITRQPILALHGRMTAENGVVDRAVGDHGRWVQIQTELLFQGPLDPQKAAFLAGQINFTQGQIDQWSDKRSVSALELNLAQVEFLKTLLQLQPSVSRKVNVACVSIRRELALAGDDLESVGQVFTRNAEQGQEFLRRMIADFEAQLQATRNAAR
ncbi:hypothetical protein [Burkholderia multivorans]|uniref:hypothetical protein n=1 Tax=Burkholderia multivorans TaxID=87883 RepID=UPI000CFFA1BA|nr:hypothetical protein [Burkholderia multivorans]PRE09676.1 hypothetical protein C6P78_27675 [Burkholderia multivorans]